MTPIVTRLAGCSIAFATLSLLWAAQGRAEEAQPVPACDAPAMQAEVTRFANATTTMKSDGLTVASLSQLVEAGATPDARTCKGTVTLSDASQHDVSFRLERNANGALFVSVNLLVFPRCSGLAAQGAALATVNAIDAVRRSGRTAAALNEQQEVSSTRDRRVCKGVVTLSDRSRHEMSYAFVRTNDDINIEVDVK